MRTVWPPLLGVLALVAIGIGLFVVVRPQAGAPSAAMATPTITAPESMAYTLDKTTYSFQTLADGGTETATADDPKDAARVKAIIGRMDVEARTFNRGEFSNPVSVQSSRRQELAALHAGAPNIHLEFAELPAGARVHFITQDRRLVSALHLWFRAQVADHTGRTAP